MMKNMKNIYGLVVNPKKVFGAIALVIFGVSSIFYGLTALYIELTHFEVKLTDAEIIERAKKLGMVELKDYLRMNGGSGAESGEKNPGSSEAGE